MKIFTIKDKEKRNHYFEFLIGKPNRNISLLIGKEEEKTDLKHVTKQLGHIEKEYGMRMGKLRVGVLKGRIREYEEAENQ